MAFLRSLTPSSTSLSLSLSRGGLLSSLPPVNETGVRRRRAAARAEMWRQRRQARRRRRRVLDSLAAPTGMQRQKNAINTRRSLQEQTVHRREEGRRRRWRQSEQESGVEGRRKEMQQQEQEKEQERKSESHSPPCEARTRDRNSLIQSQIIHSQVISLFSS